MPNIGQFAGLLLTVSLVVSVSACSSSGDDSPLQKTAVPQNVTLQPGDGQITLRWDDIPGATYNLYMGQSAGVGIDPQSSLQHMAHNNIPNPFVHTGLNNDSTYYFVVTAVSAGVESALSAEVSAQPLPPPANVSANPASESVTITWDNLDDPTVSYNLYMDTVSGVQTQAGAASQDFMLHENIPNPFLHTQLQNGQDYYFVITSVRDGFESGISTEISATPVSGTLSAPSAPANLAAGEVSSSQVPLSWQDTSNNEEGFLIERAELSPQGVAGTFVEIAQSGVNSGQFNDSTASGLVAGKHYSYRVSATNTAGQATSNSIDVIVPPRDPDKFLRALNTSAPANQENATTAQAYYDAIDPLGQKTTVTAWKQANGFSENSGLEKDTPAIYLNNADLGFGRRMYVNPNVNNSGNVASYVENFLTLDDAIKGDPANLIATVAMEYTQPALDPVAAAAKQIVIARNKMKPRPNILTTILSPGTYTLAVTRSRQYRMTLGNYQMSVSYAGQVQHSFSGQWTIPSLDTYTRYYDDINDPANPSHSFTIPPGAPQQIDVQIVADIDARVFLLGSVGTVITGDDNSGGGLNPRIVSSNLTVGTFYTIIPTSMNKVRDSHQIHITVTGSQGNEIYFRYPYILPTLGNDPPPTWEHENRFRILSPDTVTIDIVPDPPVPDLDLYAYLVGPGGSGKNVDKILAYFETDFDSTQSEVTLDLPAGDYTAVAATGSPGGSENFSLSVVEVLADGSAGASIPFKTPTPAFSWGAGSGGESPFNNTNPRFDFTISPATGQATQRVTVNLAVDPLTTTVVPVLYILGPAGEYRHVVARDTGQSAYPGQYSYAHIATLLNAGQYRVVAGTRSIGATGDFSLDIRAVNGTALLPATPVIGSWSDSDGQSFSANNPVFNFTVPADNTAVDIAIKSDADIVPVLFLTDNTGTLLNQNDRRYMTESFIEADLLAGQYQLVVTSEHEHVSSDFTLDITVDGIAQPRQTGSFSHMDKSNPYSPQSPRFPLTLTNNSRISARLAANVEVNLFLLGQGDRKITTFYTFIGAKGMELAGNSGTLPVELQNVQPGDRVLSADLDGRGQKFQPGVCNPCHGGTPKSLVAGRYPNHGDTDAGFLAWDLDLYKYKPAGQPFDRQSQEDKFKSFNKTVLGIRRFPVMGAGTGRETTRNTLIKGWYGGNGLPNAAFDGNFVPDGWRPDSVTGLAQGIPDSADQLYLNVIKPTCRLCHTQRDGMLRKLNAAGVSIFSDTALAFGSYDHFMSYQDEIESTIYDKGVMPLALRTFNHFWNEGQAEVLAQHLRGNGFAHDDNNGNVLVPGRPIAYPGPSALDIPSPDFGNRKVVTNSLTRLNGKASLFATNYQWRLVNTVPAGINVALTDATSATPSFTPTEDGDYTFGLTVNDGSQTSAESLVTITSAPAATNPPVAFATDIKPIYNADRSVPRMTPIYICDRCHSDLSKHPWRAIYSNILNLDGMIYEQSANGAFAVTGSHADLYTALRDRINLDDPLQSKILEKVTGSGDKHGDGGQDSFGPINAADTSPSWQHYNIMLNWILDGARDN